jgi:hypothetical protein
MSSVIESVATLRVAMIELGRDAEALAVSDTLKPELLAWASSSPDDWAARIRAERGIAMQA